MSDNSQDNGSSYDVVTEGAPEEIIEGLMSSSESSSSSESENEPEEMDHTSEEENEGQLHVQIAEGPVRSGSFSVSTPQQNQGRYIY